MGKIKPAKNVFGKNFEDAAKPLVEVLKDEPVITEVVVPDFGDVAKASKPKAKKKAKKRSK